MGQSTELMAKTVEDHAARRRISSPTRATSRPPPPGTRGSTTTSSSTTSASRATTTSAPIPRPRSSAKLRPTFDISGAGTLTAGNSTPLTDGASAVLLASEEWAAKRNLPVLAYLRYGKAWAVDFVERQGRPADGAGARGARDAQGCGPHAAGFRLLRDSRSLRRAGAVHAQGLGIAGLLPRRARPARRRSAASTAPSST